MNSSLQLDLTPGEWVEVRSQAEILGTLDEKGMLDGLPFMPEMLPHCGKRYQVFKRADKTCDTVNWTGLRRMERTVHLKLRCDGSVHGGCQAGCLLFWKEAWLRRATDSNGQVQTPTNGHIQDHALTNGRDHHWLEKTVDRTAAGQHEKCYRCQATELYNATAPLPWWAPKQYVRDVCMNKVSVREVLRTAGIAAYAKIVRRLTGRSFPNVAGTLKRTPTEVLDLQPGEWVIVKNKEEILATLDTKGKNRGMTFDTEMLPYCGKAFRVLRRVERLIEESTGRMIEPAGVSIILENVVCMSRFRRLCPRSIFPYWREIWLRRATAEEIPAASAGVCPEPSTVGAPSA